MSAIPHGAAFPTGLATGIGSVPFTDAATAAALVLRVLPDLPAVPQLALPREGVVAQWAGALPEITVALDGALVFDANAAEGPLDTTFTEDAHAGLLGFLDTAAAHADTVTRVKAQVVGPLTLGVALVQAGMETDRAFARAGEAVAAWLRALDDLLATRLRGARSLVFLDEPALVLWRRGDAPIEREDAVDLLSGALAAGAAETGVHVCGDGDVRLAFEAGPTVLGLPVSDAVVQDVGSLVRHLDADGWIAWGAVPTDRPVGESAEPLWRRLVTLWCDLTRRGCEPLRLRNQAIITPACGLATHGPSQAERALRLATEMADRVATQSAAARLTAGA
jgi:methionine synthase II (cobalamin-independent)